MKLPIKKKFFDKIKSGEKPFEYRDSHITFVCEETGETLKKDVVDVKIVEFKDIDVDLMMEKGLFEDKFILRFEIQ